MLEWLTCWLCSLLVLLFQSGVELCYSQVYEEDYKLLEHYLQHRTLFVSRLVPGSDFKKSICIALNMLNFYSNTLPSNWINYCSVLR